VEVIHPTGDKIVV